MKGLMFLFSGVFWGCFLLLIGVAVLLKAVFHIDLPVFSILWGLLLIAIGVSLVLGGRFVGKGLRSESAIVFGSGDLAWESGIREYSMVFSSGRTDLEKAVESDRVPRLNAVFARHEILLSPKTDALLVLHTAFGAATLPDGSEAAHFGVTTWRTKPGAKGAPKVRLEINTVFGQTEIRFK
ncbi:MAG: hypothetical protein J0L75_10710 [Spirochaetes bacterium]|nr:hypothetical protein [Spirochaetota bacterium]